MHRPKESLIFCHMAETWLKFCPTSSLILFSPETVAKYNYDWVVVTENTLYLISAACDSSGLSCSERENKNPEKKQAIYVLK